MLSVEGKDAHGGEFRWVRATFEVLVAAPPGRDKSPRTLETCAEAVGQFEKYVGRECVV